MPRAALVAITKHGTELAKRLKAAMPEAELLVAEKFAAAAPGAIVMRETVSKEIARWFHDYDEICFVISLGAVVRMIAPVLKDKHTDPGVVAVDDRGRFAISVLSGHVGGANAFCGKVAEALGATAVVTTASDVGRTLPVDILGRELGWTTEADENVTRVSAAVVNEEPVAFVQECGERNWWTRETPIPKSIHVSVGWEGMDLAAFKAFLVVTDRLRDRLSAAVQDRVVLYRPKSLVVGVGCDRGVPEEAMAKAVAAALEGAGLSRRCVRNVATIDLKENEPAVYALCERNGWPLVTFTRDELNETFSKLHVPNPSAVVKKHTGTPGVSEPSAMRSAGASRLVVEKRKFEPGITVAVARVGG